MMLFGGLEYNVAPAQMQLVPVDVYAGELDGRPVWNYYQVPMHIPGYGSKPNFFANGSGSFSPYHPIIPERMTDRGTIDQQVLDTIRFDYPDAQLVPRRAPWGR